MTTLEHPLDEFKLDTECEPDTIYRQLAAHQRHERWELQDQLAYLQAWTVRFIVEFELDLHELAIRVDKISKKSLGQHRRGHNGLGLLNEITISVEHLTRDPTWDVLGTLLHELLHVYQDTHGKTPPERKNEHNAEFRAKCRACGLIVDEDGRQGYAPNSPFLDILRHYKIELPEFCGQPFMPEREERDGKSKHTRYECPCKQSANVATTKGFWAHCDKCGMAFVPVERHKPKKARVIGKDLSVSASS